MCSFEMQVLENQNKERTNEIQYFALDYLPDEAFKIVGDFIAHSHSTDFFWSFWKCVG